MLIIVPLIRKTIALMALKRMFLSHSTHFAPISGMPLGCSDCTMRMCGRWSYEYAVVEGNFELALHLYHFQNLKRIIETMVNFTAYLL